MILIQIVIKQFKIFRTLLVCDLLFDGFKSAWKAGGDQAVPLKIIKLRNPGNRSFRNQVLNNENQII